MKSDLFKDYCEWMFPLVNKCCEYMHEKMDVYNRRDAGFICERLTHFFVMRMKRIGKRVVEKEVKNYSNHEWSPFDECDFDNFDSVYDACCRLYDERQISRVGNVIGTSIKYGDKNDERLKLLYDVMYGGIMERMTSGITMFEYLPNDMKSNIETLCSSFSQLQQMISLFAKMPTDETKQLLSDYLRTTGYSRTLVNYVMDNLKY